MAVAEEEEPKLTSEALLMATRPSCLGEAAEAAEAELLWLSCMASLALVRLLALACWMEEETEAEAAEAAEEGALMDSELPFQGA